MESANDSILEKDTPGCYLNARYVLLLMMMLGVINVFSVRNGISVAILKMATTSYNSTAAGNGIYSSECVDEDRNSSAIEYNVTTKLNISQHPTGEFDWTISQQTAVLGCYYYGYMLMNIPGALLAKRYGIRKVFGITILLSSVLTLLIPACARLNFGLLIATRSMIGFLHGAMFPTLVTGWGVWSPPAERSRMLSFTFGSYSVGNCIIFPLVGIIVSITDWDAVFYFTGGAALLWSILWLVLIHDTPAKHPRISENERRYIEESLGTKQTEKKKNVPWRMIFTSPPVLGAMAVHFADNWVLTALISFGPIYLKRVLKFDIKSAGFLSSLPFLLRFVTSFLWGFVADFVIASKIIPVLWVRKFSSCFPALVSGLSLAAIAYLGCNKWPVVILLATSVGACGMNASGHKSSYIDMAPAYGGVIYSIANTLNSVAGFLTPQLSGLLLVDNSLNSWRNVFWLAASISFAGGLAYALLASDQVQDWARDPMPAGEEDSVLMGERRQTVPSREEETECTQSARREKA